MNKIKQWCLLLLEKWQHRKDQTIKFRSRHISVNVMDAEGNTMIKRKHFKAIRFDGQDVYLLIKHNRQVVSINLLDVRSIAIWNEKRIGVYLKNTSNEEVSK